MPTLDQLKLSLRIDGTVDDDMLTGYLTAASVYIQGAIGTDSTDFYTSDQVKPLYDVAVMALASAYYNYRSASVSVSVTNVNLPVNSIIGQLRGLYAEGMGDTDGKSN